MGEIKMENGRTEISVSNEKDTSKVMTEKGKITISANEIFVCGVNK